MFQTKDVSDLISHWKGAVKFSCKYPQNALNREKKMKLILPCITTRVIFKLGNFPETEKKLFGNKGMYTFLIVIFEL